VNTSEQNEIRLNLGCGGRPLPGYVNVDKDTLEELKARYPIDSFPEDVDVYQYDIFNLPFSNESVSEIRTDSLIEHLSFKDEPRFFLEAQRVLQPGGIFEFSTPDFEEVVKIWINAKDEWKDFYRDDADAIKEEHWFGQYSYLLDNRWGYLTAVIYGPQNSEGQFHKNCYTVPKIRAILNRLDFEETEISNYMWKGDGVPMIQVKAVKK
jgi:predicted SAM-dependent methyltransferase